MSLLKIDSTISVAKNHPMPSLTSSELKTHGVAAIEAILARRREAMISVRGKDRFVVMEVTHYHSLRECELDAARARSEADVAAGRYVVESAQQHMARVEALLAADAGPHKNTVKSASTKVPARSRPSAKKASRQRSAG